MWVGFAAYLGVLVTAPRLGRGPVWIGIVALLACFALLPPLLSNDVYSYVDYARLGVLHGLDPYVHPPLAVPSDPAFAEVDWIEATSAYGPLFTLATYPLAWLSVDGAVLTLKLAAAISVLVLAATVARVAPGRGVDPTRAAAFVALNPLVLVHVVGGAHNDGLAMALGLLSVAALLAAREATGGALLVASVAIKAAAAFLAPFALLGAERRRRLLAGAAAALFATSLVAMLAFGWDWLSAFGLAGENQGRTSYMSLPATAARLTGLDPEPIRVAALALYAALVAWLLAWTWRGGDWIRAAGWAALGLLLASSWLLPWYLVWALPLAAISRDRPLQLLTLALTAYQLGARIPL
ncbi:MAG TPA: polyprenol phosphomannose-dependent alpha 1,6 mannosyltransferase MptB [Solirubrobacterales bacterium]|nr:polyprenol phosphomannose-dependent alpha 1,6 mannosyltransferase MptB [Solirubrobacterales bacterium]